MALPVKALHVGQEDYWLDQIAKDREEYFSGKGESPGRFVGDVADASGLSGEATLSRCEHWPAGWTRPPASSAASRCGAPTPLQTERGAPAGGAEGAGR